MSINEKKWKKTTVKGATKRQQSMRGLALAIFL